MIKLQASRHMTEKKRSKVDFPKALNRSFHRFAHESKHLVFSQYPANDEVERKYYT